MTKQTFTVGQVLTAAQMTSLQQTAMGGGSTTAKTASYVLVAADAGTVVQMNAAGATTITVNTALFAAGDTVQIQNIGAGVCTVTAGTATVNTSATLALKQYDAGTLYFNTTSAAIFFAVDAADSTSPLTTKGDLYGFSTLDARVPIGANNTVLTADSAQALGLKWAAPAAAASGLTFITGSSFSAVASVSLPNSTFTSTYNNYKMILNITSAGGAAAETRFRMRASGTDDTNANYYMGGLTCTYTGVNAVVNTNGGTYIPYGSISAGSAGISSQSTQFEMNIFSPQAAVATVFTTMGGRGSWTYTAQTGIYNASTAFDALTYYVDAGTITGNYRVYGLQNS